MLKKQWVVLLSLLFWSVWPTLASAAAAQVQEVEPVVRDVVRVEVSGPAEIRLGDQAVLHLPQHLVYVPEPQAGAMLAAMGSGRMPRLIGVILPIDNDGADDAVDYDNGWFIRIAFMRTGYITDNDARNCDADAMLKRFQAQVARENQERRQRGLPEVQQSGWVEKPRYDAVRRQLTWSMCTDTQPGTVAAAGTEISYNAVVLGREGYIWLELVNDRDHVAGQKPLMEALLNDLRFLPGKRYEDFSAATDQTAAYGLMTQPMGSDHPNDGLKPGGQLAFRSVYDKIIVGAAGFGAVGMVIFAGVKKWRRNKLLKRLSGNWRG